MRRSSRWVPVVPRYVPLMGGSLPIAKGFLARTYTQAGIAQADADVVGVWYLERFLDPAVGNRDLDRVRTVADVEVQMCGDGQGQLGSDLAAEALFAVHF